MPNKINVKQIMQLHEAGMSRNEIARTRHFAKDSVSEVIKLAAEKQISFSDIQKLSDDEALQLMREYRSKDQCL